MPKKTLLERLNDVSISYNHCQVCGRQPKDNLEEPNHAPLRWWNPDDGWKVGTICRWCWEAVGDRQPKPGDFAYVETSGVCDDENTDVDISPALERMLLDASESSYEEMAEYEDGRINWDAWWS